MISFGRILFCTVALGLLSGLLAVPLSASGEAASDDTVLVEAISGELPDLVVTKIKVPPNLKAMERVSIGVTVANMGQESYSTGVSWVTTSVRFSGAEVVFELPPLGAGEEVTKEIRFTFTSGRWYDIVATVDPQNEIAEFSEENNQITKRVKVSGIKRQSPKSSGCPSCGKR